MQITTKLAEVRKAHGFSAAELAKCVQVSRQTIYGIEGGTFVPNTAVALRLARVLRVSVEDLFSEEDPACSPPAKADLLETGGGRKLHAGEPITLWRIHDRLLAARAPEFPAFLPDADGIVRAALGTQITVDSAAERSGDRFVIAGCDPALSLLSRALSGSGIELLLLPAASRRALAWLKSGRVHAAGSHLLDRASGNYNLPFIRRIFPDKGTCLVTFARWEQGLVVAPGNPKSIRGVEDLTGKGIVLMNREKGSGSRDLLDANLQKHRIPVSKIAGYTTAAPGHLAAAYAVAAGNADCCIANRAAARRFGLDFIPLAFERFDLTLPKDLAGTSAARALLDVLNSGHLKRELEGIAGYDASQTGSTVA